MGTKVQEVRVIGADGKGRAGQRIKVSTESGDFFSGKDTEELVTPADGIVRVHIQDNRWVTGVTLNGRKRLKSYDIPKGGGRIEVVLDA